jgi:polysaccharide export outer membrane protein
MNRSLSAIAFVCVSSLVVGCRSYPTYDYKVEPDPRGQEFQLGPLDQLAVVVWKNKELSAEVTVRPDGVVTLPLIGDVKAAGRTTTELQQEITGRLAAYVRDEQLAVSVGVVAVNSYQFTVLGSVEHAGRFSAKNYVTTVEAIAMAGGPNRFAGDSIYIVRGTPARRIPIDLKRATSSEHANENLVVMRGDLIIVP